LSKENFVLVQTTSSLFSLPLHCKQAETVQGACGTSWVELWCLAGSFDDPM